MDFYQTFVQKALKTKKIFALLAQTQKKMFLCTLNNNKYYCL